MSHRRKGFNQIQSPKDQSLSFFYYFTQISKEVTIQFHCDAGEVVKKDQLVLTIINHQEKHQTYSMPWQGQIENICKVGLLEKHCGKIELFSAKVCEHLPLNYPKVLTNVNSSIDGRKKDGEQFTLQTRDICRFCQVPLFLYYQPHEQSITYRQFVQAFDDFIPSQLEWLVVLNEPFSKNTSLASFHGENFNLDLTGKVTFLAQVNELPSDLEDDFTMLRIKKVVCEHEKVVDSLCYYCGQTLDKLDILRRNFFFESHEEPEGVEVSSKSFLRGIAVAEKENQYVQKMLNRKKALLLLDLDNTILHSIQMGKITKEIMTDIEDYLIIPRQSNIDATFEKTLVKLRPYFKEFLKDITPFYEIFIYTKGTRKYALQICQQIREKYKDILSETNNFKSYRLISRDEDPLHHKTMQYVLPNRTDIMVILDDRRDVWNHSPNCIVTKPYFYFYHSCHNRLEAFQWENGGGVLEVKPSVKNSPKQIFPNPLIQQNTTIAEKGLPEKEEAEEKEQSKEPKAEKLDYTETKPLEAHQNKKLSISDQTVTNSKADYFLLYASHILTTLHERYFEAIQPPITGKTNFYYISQQLKELKRKILKGVKIVFIMRNNAIFSRAQALGMTLEEESENSPPNIVVRPNNLRVRAESQARFTSQDVYKKLKKFAELRFIPIVTEEWINLCYEYTYKFSYQYFQVEHYGKNVIFNEQELEEKVRRTLQDGISSIKNNKKAPLKGEQNLEATFQKNQ